MAETTITSYAGYNTNFKIEAKCSATVSATDSSQEASILISWKCKFTVPGTETGSSGAVIRYSIGGGGWSTDKSLIGNANKDKYRGAYVFKYSNGWYENSAPYFTVKDSDRTYKHKLTDNTQKLIVYFKVYPSSDMTITNSTPAEGQVEITIPARKHIFNINVLCPKGARPDIGPGQYEDNQSARFNEYIGIDNSDKDFQLIQWQETNENEDSQWKYLPKNKHVAVGMINSQKPYYELDRVVNGNEIPLAVNTNFTGNYPPVGNYSTTAYVMSFNPDNDNDIINIYMKWKESNLNLEGETKKIIYNSTQNNTVSIPSQMGYKFLGWYDQNDIQIYDENGKYVPRENIWTEDGKCLIINDMELHAKWEMQNIAYVKIGENNWQPALTYVKIEENKWQPAILYVKIEEGKWQQSII
jgi:hypothetical protein